MDDAFTSQLSAYLDDEVTPAERLEIGRHLLDCAHCRAVLDELRDVVSDAATLEEAEDEVAPMVWTRVRESIAPARARPVSLSWPQALVAAATIALAAGGTVWVAINRGAAPATASSTPLTTSAPAGPSAIPARFSDAEYD